MVLISSQTVFKTINRMPLKLYQDSSLDRHSLFSFYFSTRPQQTTLSLTEREDSRSIPSSRTWMSPLHYSPTTTGRSASSANGKHHLQMLPMVYGSTCAPTSCFIPRETPIIYCLASIGQTWCLFDSKSSEDYNVWSNGREVECTLWHSASQCG